MPLTKQRGEYRLLEFTPYNTFLVFLFAFSTLLGVGAGVLFGRLFDFLASRPAFDAQVARQLWLLGGVTLASCLASWLLADYLPMRLMLHKSIENIGVSGRHLLVMSPREYTKRTQGHLFNVVVGSSMTAGTLYCHWNVQFFGCLLSVLLLLGVAWWIAPLFALVFALYLPLAVLATAGPSKRIAELQKQTLNQEDAALGEANRLIEKKRPINVARAEDCFVEHYRTARYRWLDYLRRYEYFLSFTEGLPSLMSDLFKVCVVALAAKFYFDGAFTLGTLVVLHQLAGLLQAPLIRIVEIVMHLQVNHEHLERLKSLEASAALPSGFENRYAEQPQLAVVESGKFYPTAQKDRLLFETDGTLELPSKGLVLIKGANGSGKSMLLNYLTGFSDADAFEGRISLSPQLKNASYLTYPLLLTKGSFTDNLFGKGYDQEVAQMLGIDFFEKEIDDEKVNLSFGEGQKLNLLRVLSSPSPVLVLDEPFTNLDKETIARLTDYLLEKKQNKAIIAITHSPELDAGADAIYAIRDGQLVCEKG